MSKRATVEPTQGEVRSVLDYEPETGPFRWKMNRGGTARAGSVAGKNEFQPVPREV